MSATLTDPSLPAAATQLRKDGDLLVLNANALTVKDHEDYALAGQELQSVYAFKKRVEDALRPAKESANKTHKEICKLESDLLAGPKKAEEILKRAMNGYQIAEQRKARAEEDRIEAELRKQEVAKRVEEAKRLDAAGKKEEALAVVQAPVVLPAVAVAAPKPQADGIQTRKTWKYRIVDSKKIHAAYMVPDEKAIGAAVRSLGMKAVEAVGEGIEVFEDAVIAVRS